MDQNIFISHPIYDKYEASRDGIIRNKLLKKNVGWIGNMGYMMVTVYKYGKEKHYYSHRFIWKCFNGIIPTGLVIDHINRNKLDNNIDNLRLVTSREKNLNCKQGVKLQYKRPVMGIMDTEEIYFPSMCSAGKYKDSHHRSI